MNRWKSREYFLPEILELSEKGSHLDLNFFCFFLYFKTANLIPVFILFYFFATLLYSPLVKQTGHFSFNLLTT